MILRTQHPITQNTPSECLCITKFRPGGCGWKSALKMQVTMFFSHKIAKQKFMQSTGGQFSEWQKGFCIVVRSGWCAAKTFKVAPRISLFNLGAGVLSKRAEAELWFAF